MKDIKTRLTGYREHARDGKGIHVLHLLLRGFFPLVREASARSRSTSCARHPCSFSVAALDFLTADYSFRISLPALNEVHSMLKLTFSRPTHIIQGSFFKWIQPSHNGFGHTFWCVRQHLLTTTQAPSLT